MRRVWIALAAVLVAATALASSASAVPEQGKRGEGPKGHGSDNLLHPLAKKQQALRQKALEQVLRGKAKHDKVVEVAKGQFVELKREGTDKVFTIIVEFGTQQYPHPFFQGPPPDGSAQRIDGPLHNEIPEPDRSEDNTTLWKPDYNVAHYEDMYFNRMARYFERQSSNRYSIEGKVHGWVQVPYNQALYGRDYCGSIVCATTKMLPRDAMAVWVQQELDSGKTIAQIREYLQGFDKWDRYDLDGDGIFNEPDGFIDHFQIVHAGGDQAAGDPIYGSDAIWSHRWYSNLQVHPSGLITGFDIGTNTGLLTSAVPSNPTGVWVGDYTIQPENGGLGVFAHEYTHDLGLPDLYDTSGNTGGAENSTGFWTLMSSGANIGDGGPNGIGDAPTDLSAWELLQLGWLDPQDGKGPFYDVAFAGRKSDHKLGPNDAATKKAQALFVILPDKEVPLELGAAYEGSSYYYSGSGDNLDHFMTRPVNLPAGSQLTAKVRYQIEVDWDYAYVVVSTNGGTTWQSVPTNRSTNTDPHGQNFGHGITGTTNGQWVDLTADLSAFTGDVLLGFRYWTDVAWVEPGFQADAIRLNGEPLGDSETAAGWTMNGFRVTTGSEMQSFFNAYVAENRQYDRYDRSLRTAYNFGFLNTKPDWVEHFPYQDGLLLWYWDSSQGNNNVGDHPGEGLLLPIDAHPSMHYWPDGTLIRPRILSYDSTFGLEPTDAITVHLNGAAATIPSQPAVPVFDDSQSYWVGGSAPGRYQPGWNSVKVPNTGTQIRVKGVSAQGNFMQVEVRSAR